MHGFSTRTRPHPAARRRTLAPSLIAFLALLLCASSAWAEWKIVREHWYIIQVEGTDCGWMSHRVEEEGEMYRTSTESFMSLSRGAVAIDVRTQQAFEETRAGEPVRVEFSRTMSQQPTKTVWDFGKDKVAEVSSEGRTEKKRELPLPQEAWLTPMEADRFAQERRAAGAKEIVFTTINPEFGLTVVTATSRYVRDGKATVDGREVPVTIWNSTVSAAPIQTEDWVGADGVLVRQSLNMGMQFLFTLASKEKAMALKAGAAPEVMTKTFVAPDKPIDRPHEATRLRLRVRVKNGEMPDLPTAGAQRFAMAEDGKSGDIVVDLHNPVPAPEADACNTAYLAASTMIDKDDELIRKLAPRAIEDVKDRSALEKAEAMRAYTYRHIRKKGLEQAFASGSETARTQKGDCSEHAVLLATLLRANGIPARVACGLVYADQFAGSSDIFGWHMWTQALIEGKWVDFDATLNKRYSAAHVLTGASAMDSGPLDANLTTLVGLMGNMEIDVLEVSYD
jgi:hypothetical protein